MSTRKDKINLFTLIMLSSAFVVSIRNVPTMAETQMHMFFFGLVAAFGFFIPAALISAELATGWPKEGGIYVWVTEAFGKKWGFWASWLQWTNMLLSVISMLYFIGGSLAYVFNPDWASNRAFLIIVLLAVVWSSTFISLKGIKANSLVSTICFLGGVLFPGILIVLFGLTYLFLGEFSNLSFNFSAKSIFPDFRQLSTLVLVLAFTRTFTGIEASANHAGKVNNPSRNYPLAILIVVILGLSINLLSAVSVAVVVSKEEISLIAGIMEAFDKFFSQFNLKWIVPIMGLLVAGGAAGGANAWLLGPVKGLLQTAKRGDLPPFFQKENKNGIPTTLMFTQGIIISIIGSILLLAKNINMAFWISVALSMIIYVTMYFLMMLSAIYLRYKKPKVERKYKIPGKNNLGMWIVSSVGMLTLAFLFFIAFFPPSQLPSDNKGNYFFFIAFGMILVYSIPFVIQRFKTKLWVSKDK